MRVFNWPTLGETILVDMFSKSFSQLLDNKMPVGGLVPSHAHMPVYLIHLLKMFSRNMNLILY